MRMLHVADRLSTRGGAYTHMLSVVRELAREHDVTLAVGRREDVGAPCPVVVCPGLDERVTVPVPELETLAAEGRFDLVHVHNVVNPAVLRWARERALRPAGDDEAARQGPIGKPVAAAVVTVQDHRFFCPGRGKWTRDGSRCVEAFGERVCAGCFDDPAYFREVLALTHERLDALRHLPVIVLSEYMRGELVQAGLRPRDVHAIPPFVDGLDEDAQPDCPPCVAFVGRLAESKGVRDAVDAWTQSGIDLPLVFAGTGPLRDELEREGFEVLGWLEGGRLSALYRRARAVLLPSRWQEPFGIVGLEAQAMGVPVVAWDSGGVREWHRGEPVAWGDVDGLAQALREVVGQREDARAVARAGAGGPERRGETGGDVTAILPPAFDGRTLMDRLLRLYQEVARRR